MQPWYSFWGWFVGVLLLGPVTVFSDDQVPVADCTPPSVGAERADELWLISTRHLVCSFDAIAGPSDLDVYRYDSAAGWQPSSLAAFLASDIKLTPMYVHGNRISWSEAQRQGWTVYQTLLSCCGDIPPMRFVIWSWPSDQIRGTLRDLRVKAARADAEGSYLGWFLSQLRSDTSVSLFGYSYGSRVISGGLQLLGGGSLNGQRLAPADAGQRVRVRATYLAAALDNSWLCDGCYHGESWRQLDHLLVLYNTCDPALRRYHMLEKCSNPVALGYAGVNTWCLGGEAARVEQLDAAPWIGATHDEYVYWNTPDLLHAVCRVVLWRANSLAEVRSRTEVPISAVAPPESDARASPSTPEIEPVGYSRPHRRTWRRR